MQLTTTLPQFQPTAKNQSKPFNLGNVIGDILGFDITPGFNMTWHGPVANATPTKSPSKPRTAVNGVGNEEYNQAPLTYDQALAAGGGARDFASERYMQEGIDQTQALINSLPTRQQNTINALIDQYTKGREKARVAFTDNESDYKNSKDRVLRENVQKKNQIDSKVRSNTQSVQRLLGSRGAGSSSAAILAAPAAVASEGTQDRAEATRVYDENNDKLDTNFNRYRREYDQAEADATANLENSKRDIGSQFAQQGIEAKQKLQELLTTLASARGGDPTAVSRARQLTADINALQNKISEYAARASAPVIPANDPKYSPVATAAQSAATDIPIVQDATADPNADQTAAYRGDLKDMSDEELLKQLYGPSQIPQN